jgi:hypothetical protein
MRLADENEFLDKPPTPVAGFESPPPATAQLERQILESPVLKSDDEDEDKDEELVSQTCSHNLLDMAKRIFLMSGCRECGLSREFLQSILATAAKHAIQDDLWTKLMEQEELDWRVSLLLMCYDSLWRHIKYRFDDDEDNDIAYESEASCNDSN